MALPSHYSFEEIRNGLSRYLPGTPAYLPSSLYFAEPSLSPAESNVHNSFFQAAPLPQGPTQIPLPHLASPCPSWDGAYNNPNEFRRDSHDSGCLTSTQSTTFSPSIPGEDQSLYLDRREKSPGDNHSRLSRQGSNSSHRCKKIDPCGPFKCQWKDCRYPGLFARKAVLMRHIETQHVAPRSYECPDEKCDRCFSRKDNMEEHWRRVH